ncbi:hypothetical protein HPB47_006464, partial [Ixodes persulcatus]
CTAEAGWLVSHRQRGTRALNKLGLTATSTAKNDAGGRTENRKPRQRHRKQRQQPALPREDIKVILRPREGLDVTKVSSARLRDGVFCAIGLKEQEAEGDLLRVNPEKNIIVTSTPSMNRAKKYNSISKICIAGKTYEVTAYAAPPEDTAKGVIHNIPDYDTAEDITRSLVYNKNPTILQAQRIGKTNSAVIVFEGNKWDTAWTSARRPKTKYAALAAQRIHETGINVTPSVPCVVGIIPQETKTVRTGSKRRTYYGRDSETKKDRMAPANMAGTETAAGERKKGGREIVRAPSLVYPTADQGATTTRDSGSSAGQDLNQDAGALTPKTDISQDRHPKAADTRLREKPSRTSSAPQDAKKTISNQTSAQQADRQQQVELTKIKQMLEMVVAENAKLKAEVAKLRGSENADKVVPETQGPSRSQAPPPDQGKANTIQPTQVPLAEDSSSDEMENSEPESPPPKRKATDTTLTNAPRLSKRAEKRDAETLQHFGEKLSEMLTSKFEAMLAKFAESIGTQIAALNARVMAIEAISPRFTGGVGGTGPMKSTKPYARPGKIETHEIEDIESWVEQLHTSVQKATKTIPEEAELTQADAKLLDMWEAKQGLQKRLGKQKLNRALRRRLAILNKTIEDYSNQLSRQNWHSTCDALGLHNTLDELVEAQRIAQMERLTKSPTGRHILQTLNINYEGRLGEKHDIPPDIRGHIHIPPLPRNMHPEHNTERRQARAQALDKRFAHLEDVAYVDAADYSSRDAMAISVVDRQGKLTNSGTVFTTSSEVGEEAAIALAMTSSSRIKFIVSDSKPAILNYTRGRISSEALKILRTGLHGDRVRGVLIVWAPAHSGLPGNENANDAARGLTDRADVTTIIDAHSFRRSDRDRLVAYRDVINHYRLGRAKYPAADRTLSKWQAVAWRLLQTNTFPNPVAYSRCYPGLYSSACKHCGDRADLQHMWETVLLSSDPGEQVRLVQMAEAAAKEQELLAAD